MEDREIIDLYLARSEDAITKTEEKYGHMIKAIGYRILNNHADSEECAGDTYFAAWQKIPPQIPKYLPAFLGRIARNIALDKRDYYTAAKRSREFEALLSELDEIVSDGETPEQHFESSELAECINAYLRKSRRTKRMVFVRRYWYNDSIAEIAARFDFSESKVKSMLMRMRYELKNYLKGQGMII